MLIKKRKKRLTKMRVSDLGSGVCRPLIDQMVSSSLSAWAVQASAHQEVVTPTTHPYLDLDVLPLHILSSNNKDIPRSCAPTTYTNIHEWMPCPATLFFTAFDVVDRCMHFLSVSW